MKKLITKDMLIGDLIEKYPSLGEVLGTDYGFHCIGCMAVGMETLEQGARVHGYSAKEISKMVTTLNQLLADEEKEK